MSGGTFDYNQWAIKEIIKTLEDYIQGRPLDDSDVAYYIESHELTGDEENSVRLHHRTIPNIAGYSPETINEFKTALKVLKTAHTYAQRIDWLMAGDDGEESFHERLKEELAEIDSEEASK